MKPPSLFLTLLYFSSTSAGSLKALGRATGRKMFSLPYSLPTWRSCVSSMILWTQKRFLMGTSLSIGSVSFVNLATPAHLSFFSGNTIWPKRPIWRILMSIPIQSQRENCKVVACFLSHYYSNRRQKIVLVSTDNFPFAWNDLVPAPASWMCVISRTFPLDYLPIPNMP